MLFGTFDIMKFHIYETSNPLSGEMFKDFIRDMNRVAIKRNEFSENESGWISYLYPHLQCVRAAFKIEYENGNVRMKMTSGSWEKNELEPLKKLMEKYGLELSD